MFSFFNDVQYSRVINNLLSIYNCVVYRVTNMVLSSTAWDGVSKNNNQRSMRNREKLNEGETQIM